MIARSTDVTFFMAKDKEDVIEKYYKQNPNVSDRILIYPEGCATIYTRQKIFPVRKLSNQSKIHGAALRAHQYAELKKSGY